MVEQVLSNDGHGQALSSAPGATHVTKAGATMTRIVLQRSERDLCTRSRSRRRRVSWGTSAADAPTGSLKSQLTAGTTAAGRLLDWLIAWLVAAQTRRPGRQLLLLLLLRLTVIRHGCCFDKEVTEYSVCALVLRMPWLRLLTAWRVVVTCTW